MTDKSKSRMCDKLRASKHKTPRLQGIWHNGKNRTFNPQSSCQLGKPFPWLCVGFLPQPHHRFFWSSARIQGTLNTMLYLIWLISFLNYFYSIIHVLYYFVFLHSSNNQCEIKFQGLGLFYSCLSHYCKGLFKLLDEKRTEFLLGKMQMIKKIVQV